MTNIIRIFFGLIFILFIILLLNFTYTLMSNAIKQNTKICEKQGFVYGGTILTCINKTTHQKLYYTKEEWIKINNDLEMKKDE